MAISGTAANPLRQSVRVSTYNSCAYNTYEVQTYCGCIGAMHSSAVGCEGGRFVPRVCKVPKAMCIDTDFP